MQRKVKKFEWTEECAVSFKQIKHLLTNAPVLNIVDPEKEFVVCTDACKRILGGIFMYEGQLICYESKKLNKHKQNYVTHDLELAMIIYALNMWRYYILGRMLVLMSDHSGLRYLFDQPNLNVRKARWLSTINEFDFEIKHLKRKDNQVANALSQKVHYIYELIAVLRKNIFSLA